MALILPGALADVLHDVLSREEAALAAEGASHGLDALRELELQAVLARGLASAFRVEREAHYPSSRDARRSHRLRCDFVLTAHDTRDGDAGESLWLEVKVAHQFREGFVRNPRYREQWRTGIVADLRKMAGDRAVPDAAFAIVAFTESEARASDDLESFERWLLSKGVEVGFRKARPLPIVDRRGHTTCTVAVWPVLGTAGSD